LAEYVYKLHGTTSPEGFVV